MIERIVSFWRGSKIFDYLLVPQEASWSPDVDAGFEEVLGYYGSCSHHDAGCDRHGENSGVGSDDRAVAYQGFLPIGGIKRDFSRTDGVVDEGYAMAYEAVFADGDFLTYETMRLDSRAGPNDNTFLDFNKGSDKHVVTDLAFV